jgi:hypothetical protein
LAKTALDEAETQTFDEIILFQVVFMPIYGSNWSPSDRR